MKQRYARLSVACTPGTLTRSAYLPVFGEGIMYMRVQASLRGDPTLIGAARLSVSGISAPYSLNIFDGGDTVDSRVIALDAAPQGNSNFGFTLTVDPGATFPSGQVTAEVLFEAPESFSFVWSSDGGPSFVLTLQAD